MQLKPKNRPMKLKRLFIVLFCALCAVSAMSQDLRCQVSVSSKSADGNVDRTIYQEMQRSIQELINGIKWCNYTVGPEERIECTMQFTINERVTDEKFRGKLNYAVRRPVYNTSYTTTLLSGTDEDIEFDYVQGSPLVYNENSFDDNLTSLVGFYVNIFLGVFFDSFALNAGSEYYEKAQAIVNNAQSAVEPGWRSYQKTQRNRYWIAENLLNPSYKEYHDYLYKLHLKGLDVMAENMELGRSYATQAIENLRNVNRQKSGLYIITLTLDAKRDELIKMYTEAGDNDKNKFIQYMNEIDPANASKYNAIKK